MLTGMLKTCVVCGTPSPQARCPRHRLRPTATAAHRAARRQLLATATHCWRCGKPFTPTDPLQADHILPRALGGTDTPNNYGAAHQSCNARAGAALSNGAA